VCEIQKLWGAAVILKSRLRKRLKLIKGVYSLKASGSWVVAHEEGQSNRLARKDF